MAGVASHNSFRGRDYEEDAHSYTHFVGDGDGRTTREYFTQKTSVRATSDGGNDIQVLGEDRGCGRVRLARRKGFGLLGRGSAKQCCIVIACT